MDFSSFRVLVRKILYEDQHGPLPGNPDAPTSSLFVARELENLGLVFDYLSVPADQNTCFPTVVVYTTARRGLPVQRAIQLIRDSQPRRIHQQSGVISAWYGREPNDPNSPDHYKYFLPTPVFPSESSSDRIRK